MLILATANESSQEVPPPMSNFSDYVVYVDESGDHGLTKFDANFPVFVLNFCVFRKHEYITGVVPALQEIKFRYWGHDMVVFHEHEIARREGVFAFPGEPARYGAFLTDTSSWVAASPFVVIAVVIRKKEFVELHALEKNVYHEAMKLGVERVNKYLGRREEPGRLVHFVFEMRGGNEDKQLKSAFRQVCEGDNYKVEVFNFKIVVASKQVNSTGLQLADLIARPIGRHVLNPDQPNQAFDVIVTKFDRHPETGDVKGYGLKTYP